jgi:hypothetical protein
MNSEELIQELQFNDKWLTDEYKQSPYYREYLQLVFKDLETIYS